MQRKKSKGKGHGGKGEHWSKGGARSKGRHQVENSVMDDVQGNTGVMRSEEEEENHREDVRKLVEMMQKETEKEEAADGEQQHSGKKRMERAKTRRNERDGQTVRTATDRRRT